MGKKLTQMSLTLEMYKVAMLCYPGKYTYVEKNKFRVIVNDTLAN